jgi:hypothetical protein
VNEKNTPFKFSAYGIKEWDMVGPILKMKKNMCVPDLLEALTNKYEELERVAKSLGIDHQKALASQGLTIPEQTQSTRRKRKEIGQEPEHFIAALHCNRSPPEAVKFIPNQVIKHPEFGIFFIDEFGQPAFQRVSDIHLVEATILLAYKLMALHVKSLESEEFIKLMEKMMSETLQAGVVVQET